MRTIAAVTNKVLHVGTIRDIVNSRTCLTFGVEERVSDIVRAMHGHHSGAAAVCDTKGRLIGLITEREILRRLFGMKPETVEQHRFFSEAKPVMDLTAWDVMIARPDCLSSDMDIEEALEAIAEKGYRYMPVLEKGRGGVLLGVVGERELFMHAQEKIRREMEAKDSLLSYFMHHEPYGSGVVFDPAALRLTERESRGGRF